MGRFFNRVGVIGTALEKRIGSGVPEMALLGEIKSAKHTGSKNLMLIATGGEERTASQYAALLDQAGFRMTRVVPTSLVSIVEAAPR